MFKPHALIERLEQHVSVPSARANFAFLEAHFVVNPAIKARIEALGDTSE